MLTCCVKATPKAALVFGICSIFLFGVKGGYAVQPPPPPLKLPQLKTLIARADLVVLGQIAEVNEAKDSIEASLRIEELLKGEIASQTGSIIEIYEVFDSQPHGSVSKEGGPEKTVVRSIAGPRTYHGKYRQGERVLLLLEKLAGSNRYRPLGSGTYNEHLGEFLIGEDGIKTYYFRFSDDVEKYRANENQFVDLIKSLIKSSLNKPGE